MQCVCIYIYIYIYTHTHKLTKKNKKNPPKQANLKRKMIYQILFSFFLLESLFHVHTKNISIFSCILFTNIIIVDTCMCLPNPSAIGKM